MKADFSGYATKNNLKCADGKTIMDGAFKHNDKMTVPLVWAHQHDGPENILGHAILENRPDGVYAHGFFNETAKGKDSKELVRHGDVKFLSIFANNLRLQGDSVFHGNIREVSLVIAGANPGAKIENVYISHGDTGDITELDDEVIIHTGIAIDSETEGEEVSPKVETIEHADKPKTIAEIVDSMTAEQKEVLHFMVGEAMDGNDDGDSDDTDDSVKHELTDDGEIISGDDNKTQEGNDTMTHNLFEGNGGSGAPARKHLTQAQITELVHDGIKMGSMKESFLKHAEPYGITDINILFPDAKALASTPELLARQAEWVPKVLGATKHAPFSKIKSIVADLTAEEARAKGYITGKMKKDEVITLMRRTTGPTTIYKKQKLDRDNIIDITDFDVIAWLKWEIRFMLNEEIARAILIGDGREAISDDKIKDPAGAVDGNGIRSILHDSDLYAHKVDLVANVSPEDQVDEITRSRTHYRGSGSPSYYTTDKNLTDLLLLKDKMGRRLYATVEELASAIRVKEIVSVEVMEEEAGLLGIVVNLTDYTVGTNKGGEVSFFEDFDIDFNQNKFLMETRSSGALTKPKSAIVIRRAQGTLASITPPSFNGATNTITINASTGVDFFVDGVAATGTKVITADAEVTASPEAGYYFAPNTTTEWNFSYNAG